MNTSFYKRKAATTICINRVKMKTMYLPSQSLDKRQAWEPRYNQVKVREEIVGYSSTVTKHQVKRHTEVGVWHRVKRDNSVFSHSGLKFSCFQVLPYHH